MTTNRHIAFQTRSHQATSSSAHAGKGAPSAQPSAEAASSAETAALIDAVRDEIKRQAREAARSLPSYSVQDVAQELVIALLKAIPAYQASRSPWPPFAAACLRQRVVQLVRKDQKERTVSINELEVEELGQIANRQFADNAWFDEIQYREELKHLYHKLAPLPEELRRFAICVALYEDPAEVQARLGLSHSAYYRKVDLLREKMVKLCPNMVPKKRTSPAAPAARPR